MAGGDLGVPRGVSGIGVIGKRDNCHPELSLLAGVDTEGSRHPLRVRSQLGGIMAPAKHWGRGLESWDPRGSGALKKKGTKIKKQAHFCKTSLLWEDRADSRGRHRLMAGASLQGLAWHLGALP